MTGLGSRSLAERVRPELTLLAIPHGRLRRRSCVPRAKSLLAEADERDQDDGLPLTAAIRSQRASPAVTV